MENLHHQCLLSNVLGQQPREIKNLIKKRIQVLVADSRLEDLLLVRKEEENDERTAGDGRGSLGNHGEVVRLLDVDCENPALDVVVERELESWV